MRLLKTSFCDQIMELFKQYMQQVPGDDDSNLDLWTKHMIHAVYEDWKDEKLTDAEFAHLVDNIMCY